MKIDTSEPVFTLTLHMTNDDVAMMGDIMGGPDSIAQNIYHPETHPDENARLLAFMSTIYLSLPPGLRAMGIVKKRLTTAPPADTTTHRDS